MKHFAAALFILLAPGLALAETYDQYGIIREPSFHRDIARFHRDASEPPPVVQPAVARMDSGGLYVPSHRRGVNQGAPIKISPIGRSRSRDTELKINVADNDHNWRGRGNDHDQGRHAAPPARSERSEHRAASNKHWRGWSRDHDIRYFRQRDMASWRGGHWWHGRRDGRDGWWWVLGSMYYYYPRAVYPYPDPYVPPVVEAAEPSGYWYYCADPSGYYPYVNECYVPWRAVVQ